MKVLMVLNRYFPMIGGAEVQCQRLVRTLKGGGEDFEIEVLTSNHTGALKSIDTIDEVPVRRLALNPLGVFGFYIRLVCFLFVHGQKFQVFHCHNISNVGVLCGVFARLFGRLCVLKLTVEGEMDHALSGRGFVGRVRSKLLRFALKTSVVVALTEQGREELIRNRVHRFELIPNGIDVDELNDMVGIRSPKYDCGFVGRFTDQKRLGFLVTEFAKVKKRNLLLVGGGEYQAHNNDADLVDQMSKESNGRIVCRPAQNPPLDFYRDVRVFISASAKEGLSNSLLEALALGMPCILSSIPSHVEMKIKNPKSFIYLFESSEELLQLLLDDQVFLQFGGEISAEFRMQEIAKRYVDMYHKYVTV